MSSDVQEFLQQMQTAAITSAPPMRRGVEEVVEAGRRRRTQQRLLRVGGAVVTVAAVTAAIALPRSFADGGPAPVPATVPSHSASPAPARPAAVYPAQPFAWGFRGYSAGEFTVSDPVLVTPGYQEMYVRRGAEISRMTGATKNTDLTAPAYSALLTVYRPGVFQPTRWAKAKPVEVNGHAARYSDDMRYHAGDDLGKFNNGPKSALAWQYAEDAWAVLTSTTPAVYTEAELLTVAAGLTPAPAKPAKTALRLTWTPPGYVLASGGITADYPNGATFMAANLMLVRSLPAYTALAEPVDAAATGTAWIRVSLYPVEFTEDSHQHPGKPATCNSVTHGLCYRMTVDQKYLYETTSSDGVSQDDLRHILDSAQVANPHEAESWFPLAP